MNTIAVDKLMDETRRLAALYRQSTGQTLPISAELARFDAANILHLSVLDTPMRGVDFVGLQGGPYQDKKIQVKSRVIFNENGPRYRIGQLNIELPWDIVVLVLYADDYQPFAIYGASKETILENHSQQAAKGTKGFMSLAKFKVISDLIWTQEFGIEWDEIWSNQPKSAYPS